MPRKNTTFPTIYAVTLGCPKNRVDTEVMLGAVLSRGGVLVADPREADVILVNTCGFLGSARRESIDTLRGLADVMRPGCRLVVAGCMVELFRGEIKASVPEAQVFIGTREILSLPGRLFGEAVPVCVCATAANPRLVTTLPHSAYLKVSDGCDRRCAFCIIPRIKGRQRSREPSDVVAEASALVSTGVREIVLVAQDLSHYGSDLPGRPDLAHLVERLSCEVRGLRWLRLMYLYPRDVPESLLETLNGDGPCLPYLDIPVQHGSDRMLGRMRRGTSSKDLLHLVDRIRSRVPGIMLRTTYLVGHPGEGNAEFEELLTFAKAAAFDLAGVFAYSREALSYSARLAGQVPQAVKTERVNQLEALLTSIAAGRRQQLVGQAHSAVIESGTGRGGAFGRLWFQAPEVDGGVRVTGRPCPEPGSFVTLRITGAQGADFTATLVEE